ncbi:MAG TPA: phage tail sheath C-terminal domain-containing protein [Opitutus sp.]|nr:phage tail sheath C-terminal domain-containing protein [Opitutus sp.]
MISTPVLQRSASPFADFLMLNYKAPGIYIEELNLLPSRIAAVPTAVPAFIGYTARATQNGRSLHLRLTRINSFAEFQSLFGKLGSDRLTPAPDSAQINARFTLVPGSGTADFTFAGRPWDLKADGSSLSYFYSSLKLFYANGGGACYIVSVGRLGTTSTDTDSQTNPHLKLDSLLAGLRALAAEIEPTLVVVPDATLLTTADNALLNQATLQHCANTRSRIALFDVRGADAPDASMWTNSLATFRNGLGDTGLDYGAAYYPFLRTTILQANDVTAKMIGARVLRRVLPNAAANPLKSILTEIERRPTSDRPGLAQLDADLRVVSPAYAQIHERLLERVNTLPPSSAIAGVINTVDSSGVWKAPANVALHSVCGLTFMVKDHQQAELNVDPLTGKSINAIRVFPGKGMLVWGARTLDGHSNEWRYLSVRRTTIMIGQSIKRALQPFAFETNSAATWTRIRSMVENFLNQLWRQGALIGTKPEQAYLVRIGQGVTMSEQDVSDGVLKLSVMLALLRPGEFHVLTFQQKQGA